MFNNDVKYQYTFHVDGTLIRLRRTDLTRQTSNSNEVKKRICQISGPILTTQTGLQFPTSYRK